MWDISFGQVKYLFLEQIHGIYYSDLLIVLLLAAFVTIIPGYVLHIKNGVTGKRILHVFLTVAYAGIMLLLTILRRQVGSKSLEVYTYLNLGLTSSGIYSRMQVIYSFMNFALFVPWGVLIGLYRTDQNPGRILIMTTLIGFITSFAIEFIQLITGTGNFEVTDLFTNVLGSAFGAILVCIFVIIRGLKTNE